jgi:ABC-type lipoprotein export system ATPase subunit
MVINNRKNDSIVEREIAKFLDEKLYSNKDLFSEFVRTDDKEEQIKGSDLILSTSDGVLYRKVIDEKVAARYANTDLNTFSLELSFIGKNGDKRCGWFVDYTKITDYYLFGWIKKADIPYDEEKGRYDTDAINKDNIKELDWALVSRQKIMKFLEKKGWTLDKLALQDKKIRENGGVKTKEFINDISFRYSDAYIEKPINILLKKETYMELAHLHGTIVCNEEQKDKVSNNNVEGNKIILKSTIVNDNFTQYLYDNYDIQNRDITTTEVPIPSQEDMKEMNSSHWNIMLICGKSGSGKSTILKEIGNVKPIEYDYNKAVISQFNGYTEEEVCDLLGGVGLSSVPTWLRKPQELSNGERARLDLCKAIYDAGKGQIIYVDEFTSVVNRDVAKSMSHALQRYIRQKDLKIIIASCHFDIIEWLQPDYVFNLNHRDEEGNVEMEKMEYTDDNDYSVHQSVRDIEVLSEPRAIN